jgi:hypothetical protein
MSRILPVLAFLSVIILAGCQDVKTQSGASYPTKNRGSDKIRYTDEKRETIWGEGETLGSKVFGDDEEASAGASGIGVNSFLWRASLDTIAFMPLASADPFGGVILTDWYENPETPGERFKVSIYILDKQLRADGLRVSAFKQRLSNGQWRDIAVPAEMAANIENTILTRARDLRVAQLGPVRE